MFRLISVLLTIVVVFGIVGCSETEKGSPTPIVEQQPSVVATERVESAPIDPTESAVTPVNSGAVVLPWVNIADGISGLRDYQSEMTISFEPELGSSLSGPWQIETNYSSSESAQTELLEIDYAGVVPDTEFPAMVVGHFGDNYFVQIPEVGCIPTTEEEFNQIGSGVVDPDFFLGGLSHLRLLASNEMVNGQPGRLYAIDKGSLPYFAGDDVSVDGQLFVTDNGDYPIHLNLTVSGPADYADLGQIQDGIFTLELNVSSATEGKTIVLPQDCLGSEKYPIPESAYNITALEDLLGFRTRLSIAEVVAFYQEEMATAGWTIVEEPDVFEEIAFLAYIRNGIEIMITVEQGPAIGEVSVLISP